MRISYDRTVDAVYITLNKKGKYSRTQKVTDQILVDVTKKGQVIGIEILDASEVIPNLQKEKVKFTSFASA